MKTPINWLSEYVDIKDLSPEKISDGLRLSGTENVLEKGLNIPNVVIGEIKEISKHPNADKLQITKTDVGRKNGGILQIVCGAPNIKVGQRVPVALIGTKFGDFEIKKAKIRDIESSGMLCSEKELEISDDHSGIMILKADAKVGQKLSEYLSSGDVVIDAELTPNRGDCLSVIGMAREVAATFDLKFKMPKIEKPDIKTKKTINVEVLEKTLCPRYIARVVEGVKIGPSPKWMQEKLISCGVRPISNVVDVTNYVMLEWGQPLHAFDGDKLSGKIIVRKAKEGEKLVTLDNQERKLTKDDLLICDAKKPVALAGVMGGLNSEVDEKTKTVVLEAAVFNSTSIRKAAQRLNLRSEASNRFEKGIPLTLPEIAIERAANLLTEIPGGLAGETPVIKPKAGENTDVLSKWKWIQHVGLSISDIKKYLGVEIEKNKALDILKSLGFEVEEFDFKKEARSHVGKPYILGASYKTHGDMAFDCSYLTDYIYSKIGKFIGYTALAQASIGSSIEDADLKPGDLLFISGHSEKEIPDSYFVPDGDDSYKKIKTEKYPEGVRHVGLYIGDNRIIHAKMGKKVVEEDIETFTKNPNYLGAKRFISDPENYLAITVPWWRLDIKIKEDILEEIARIYGYDKIPSTLPSGLLSGNPQIVDVLSSKKIKNKLMDIGLTEVITYSFVSSKLINIAGNEVSSYPKISNPLSMDQEYMRGNVWPSLLEVLAKNQDSKDEIKIFEKATVYEILGKGCKESKNLSIAISAKNTKESFFDAKGILDEVLSEYNIQELELKKSDYGFFTTGQSADIFVDSKKIGYIGVASRKISEKFGLKNQPAIVEINLDLISDIFGRKVVYKKLPKYPISLRDINIVLSNEIFISEIIKIISAFSDEYFIGYKIVDVYEGKGLPEGKKSVTIRLTFGSNGKTLTDEEITESLSSVTKKIITKTEGELRG